MRFVAMGDSLTAGIDETPPGTRWTDLLAARVRERQPALVYENLAIYGQMSTEVRAAQLDAALAGPVDVATLLCGGNDVMKLTRPDADTFAFELDAMFGALRGANAEALLIGGRIADVSELLPYRERSRVRVRTATAAFNAVIDEVAARYDVRAIDLSIAPSVAGADFLATDGYHPSVAGQRAIYEAAVAELAGEPLVAGAGHGS